MNSVLKIVDILKWQLRALEKIQRADRRGIARTAAMIADIRKQLRAWEKNPHSNPE